MTTRYSDTFKTISIRGRVAFCICCLRTFSKPYIHSTGWQLLWGNLWRFNTDKMLDDWQNDFAECLPDSIAEFDEYEDGDFEYLNKDQFESLRALFKEFNSDQCKAVALIYFIGTSEMYGKAIPDGSSLKYLEEFIDIMNRNNVSLPTETDFKKFPFDQANGWGNEIQPSEVNC